MSISMYESQVKRYRTEIEKQQSKRAAADQKVARAESAALKYEQEASRSSSASTVRSKLSQADNKRKEASKAREAAAKASAALADAQKKLFEAERKLTEARAKADRSQADKERRERERAERHRRQEERRREQHERAREAEMLSLRAEHAELASQLAAQPWANAPEEITVLFIAASPEDQDPLRLDQEVAEVQRRLRMSEHRDSIRFAWRPAARTMELMQHLNEHRPHVVHFSGHSDQHGLAFEDADGLTKVLDAAQLSNLLSVASDRIRLAIFNSCQSSGHAEAACDYIDAAIGMEQSVGDASAKIFAAQLYNSLGFGHSLRKAFDQARAQLEIETGGVSGDPQLFVAPGRAADDIYLVAPPA